MSTCSDPTLMLADAKDQGEDATTSLSEAVQAQPRENDTAEGAAPLSHGSTRTRSYFTTEQERRALFVGEISSFSLARSAHVNVGAVAEEGATEDLGLGLDRLTSDARGITVDTPMDTPRDTLMATRWDEETGLSDGGLADFLMNQGDQNEMEHASAAYQSIATPPHQGPGSVDDDRSETMPGLSPIPCGVSVQSNMSGLTSCFSKFSWRSRSVRSMSARSMSLASFSNSFNKDGSWASVLSRSDSSSRCLGRGPLHIALAKGAPASFVDEMLFNAQGDRSITRQRDKDDMTPLHLAMKRKAPNEDAVLAVLVFDPKVAMYRDHSGRTPLHWAIKSGASPGIVEALLGFAPGAAKTADSNGCLPLHCIDGRTPLRSIELVLAKYPVAALRKDSDQSTPLHKLCRQIVDNSGVIQSQVETHLLLEMARKPTQEDRSGDSPLGILLDGCLKLTDQFLSDIDMSLGMLSLWGKQYAPLNDESIGKLTRLNMQLRELNSTVEQVVSDTYAKQTGRWASSQRGPDSYGIRQAKRNRSNETANSSSPMLKQGRLDQHSATATATSVSAADSSFPNHSKATTGTTAPTTAPSSTGRSSIDAGASSSSRLERRSVIADTIRIGDAAPNTNAPSPFSPSGMAESASYLESLGLTLAMCQPVNEAPCNNDSVASLHQHDSPPSISMLDPTVARMPGQYTNDTHQGIWNDDLQMQRIQGSFTRMYRDALGSDDTDPVSSNTGESVAGLSSEAGTQAPDASDHAGVDGNLNAAEIAVKHYQTIIKKERDVTKKADLILEMYKTQACHWSEVKARKTFMKRAFKIARCIHACYNGDKIAFSKDHTTLDQMRFKCRNGMEHRKPRGANEGDHSIDCHQSQNDTFLLSDNWTSPVAFGRQREPGVSLAAADPNHAGLS